ncbi:MAG: NAD(P)H-dependent oxidoreductase [Coriobacteriales bacterium]|jgi:multimeric flavodoxin WrbA|nr:NAD(P)H-dependent oxidoreductase [Coriobacteriales bacterium]
MSNIVVINTSPRKRGTSAMLVGRLKDHLEAYGDNITFFNLYSHLKDLTAIFEAVSTADCLVICGPCYTNTYSADTTHLLEELATRPGLFHGQSLYGIIQGGMPYAHTHISGLNMLKLFAGHVDISYRGGFIMGLGAMLDGQPIEKLPNGKKVKKQLTIFFDHIHNSEPSPDSVYQASLMKIPGFVVRVLAMIMNHRIYKAFAARGMDARQPSPYLSDEVL